MSEPGDNSPAQDAEVGPQGVDTVDQEGWEYADHTVPRSGSYYEEYVDDECMFFSFKLKAF